MKSDLKLKQNKQKNISVVLTTDRTTTVQTSKLKLSQMTFVWQDHTKKKKRVKPISIPVPPAYRLLAVD